jgi:ubiquinone/menaquinone biosynthesis C-methylase UbiE
MIEQQHYRKHDNDSKHDKEEEGKEGIVLNYDNYTDDTIVTKAAKAVYDDKDAQLFYRHIWGDETVHVGRYDLLTPDEQSTLPVAQQIIRAQEHCEEELLHLIQSKFGMNNTNTDTKITCVDFGCGYGSLLRRLYKANLLSQTSHSIGIDIAHSMCQHARELNTKYGCDNIITIVEGSILQMPCTIPDDSVDMVISMEALLHVGPTGQQQAIHEASRILKPHTGWMIFTDIVQNDTVTVPQMQPIYDRLSLVRGMGTVRQYQRMFEKEAGFCNFVFEPYSTNLVTHYSTVLQVLQQDRDQLGLSKEFQTKLQSGLQAWVNMAPDTMEWGFFMAQKK